MPVKPPRPYYVPVADEEQVFKAAYTSGLSVVLKGPTGCGKTRFVEAMAHDLDRPLITVACHDDLTTADLVGRFLLRGGDTTARSAISTRSWRPGRTPPSCCIRSPITDGNFRSSG
jgi:nitric oxide reductase NorQ protein